VKLLWPLSTNTDFTLTGPATPVDESWKGMVVQNYATPNSAAIWPVGSGYDATRKTQRNVIEGNAWPAGEIDEVSTRYIQFGIAANKGTVLNIDSIGLYVCGAGGSGMRCRISYSTDHFANRKVLTELLSMVSNTIYAASAIPVLKLEPGDTLLLRVYPWYNGAATGKTICLADVCIHGVATTGTSVIQSSNKNPIRYSVSNRELIVTGIDGKCKLNIYHISGAKLSSNYNRIGSEIHIPFPSQKGICFFEMETVLGRNVIKYLVQ
jgi:hypothetical protein